MAGYVFQLGDTMSYNRKVEDRQRIKSARQRSLEKELYLDKRYHSRKVTGNKGRSREWRYIIDEDEDESSTSD
jgi:hypothetical protein